MPQEDGPDDGHTVPEDKRDTGTGGGSVGWKPKYDRKQSFSQQDLKREMQMKAGNKTDAQGFSEAGGNDSTFDGMPER